MRKKDNLAKTKFRKVSVETNLIPDEAFEPKNIKFRVTMFVDLDVLDAIRKEAKEEGLPYQTYINQLLRAHIDGDNVKDRLETIEKKLGIRKHSKLPVMHMGKKRI